MLATLAGQISAIDAIPSPPILAPYRHEDCYAQLDAVLRYIDDKLTPITSNFELLAFIHGDEGSFSQLLPDGVDHELIIEIKPRPGQSPEEIGRWLEQSMISSAHLTHELGVRRLLGATSKVLEVEEMRRLGLRAGGLFYRIENQTIDYEGQATKVFHARKSLVVKGLANLHVPSGIILYRKRLVASSSPSTYSRHVTEPHATPMAAAINSDDPKLNGETHGSV